jgi:hypothetical protein
MGIFLNLGVERKRNHCGSKGSEIVLKRVWRAVK